MESAGVIRPVITVPNPILTSPCSPITKYTEDEKQLVADLFHTMRAANGIGLAAPQIGVPLQVAVIEIPQDEIFDSSTDCADPKYADPIQIVLLNPVIVAREGADTADEGCLSILGVRYAITRAAKVTVKVFDPSVGESGYVFEGLLARSAQHEIDHLNGVLITDRLREQGTANCR